MRLLHTADWHLGQSLHGVSREYEHARFLDWLEGELAARAVDLLVVAGDVFDGQNPPVSAQRLLFGFLARARRARPDLAVVIIAGNHDSGGRLEAPSPLLEELGVRVVGALARRDDGSLDLERLLLPLAGGGWCVAVPYLRPADLPAPAAAVVPDASGPDASDAPAPAPAPAAPAAPDAAVPDAAVPDASDPEIAGVRAVYGELFAAVRARRRPGEPVIALGHCYMAGGALSEFSERKILRGNLHALPAALFPVDADYVALGHLHRAQPVGGREVVRYSGSPIPLALDEADYPHQLVQVDFREGRFAGLEIVRVPRFVAILRLAASSPEAVAEVLAPLPEAAGERETWPLLELTVRLDEPAPGLRGRVEEALAGKAVRLVRLALETGGHGRALTGAAVPLSALAPEEVFRRCWARAHGAEPSSAHLAAFHELLEAAHDRDGEAA